MCVTYLYTHTVLVTGALLIIPLLTLGSNPHSKRLPKTKQKKKTKNIALDGARTLDLWLIRPILYRLSYKSKYTYFLQNKANWRRGLAR